ncbi:hypothetical protein JYT34_01055 [Olleya sp. AH-315-K02]|nr:hypothetical protein [Olleya sp. AH-315-K02]
MKILKLLTLLTVVSLLFFQCSNDSEELTSSTISGYVVKGPVANAVVTVYQYDQDGTRGEVLISTNSAEDGSFSVEVNFTGVVEIVVTGGVYTDEASMNQVALGSFELRSVVNIQGNVTTGVTALTTIAAANIDENATEGLAIAIENANRELVEAMGIPNLDISKTIPVDLGQSMNMGANQDIDSVQYAVLQAGLSQIVETNNLDPEALLTLINDLTEDFRDGLFDGRSGEEALTYASGLTPEQAIQGLSIAMETFLNSSENGSGLTFSDIFGN